MAWYVTACKDTDRRYLAGRLQKKLTGAALGLAMTWQARDFDKESGVLLFLKRLAASPLVRRALPDAFAVLSRYFTFKRQPGEGISNFLVREIGVHEDLLDALGRLRDEKRGITAQDFALPLEKLLSSSTTTDGWSSHN